MPGDEMGDNETKGPDALAGEYQQIFEKPAFARLDLYEKTLVEAINKDAQLKSFLEKHFANLNLLRPQIRNIARQAAAFLRDIDEARYSERLEEIDNDLARRERVLVV